MVRRKATQERESMTMMGEDVADPGGEAYTQTATFDVQAEFQKVYDKAIKLGLTQKDFAQMEILRDIAYEISYMKVFMKYGLMIFSVAVVLFYLLFFMLLLDWPVPRDKLISSWLMMYGSDIDHEQCVIDMPETMVDLLRPPVECSFCENMDHVDTVTNISPGEFEEMYAYTGVPVVISDGTKNWTATQAFSFEFFKGIYKEGSPALENHDKHCQFFPYKTSFRRLVDVMEMNDSMAKMEEGSKPWYVGWSNCDFSAANILRQHYKRPYFLPKLSESSKTDWIFMGSPGYGAHMHIDNVGNPSWQAQITGTKRWTLQPPPECYFTCPESLEVTVQPGQIIVLDTNIWYHSTLNVGDSISITIGSEYD